MGAQKITSTMKEKIPGYVAIYNCLYRDIINGTLAEGTVLPSEAELTKQYGVSRNTLRQALTVLTEDGLISKRQGKGTVVNQLVQKTDQQMKHIVNPMLAYAKEPIEAIDISFNFSPPTEVAQQKLNINANEILMASNVVYYTAQKAVGRAFIQIPAKHIEKIDLDLNKEEDVSKLVNETIFEIANSLQMTIRAIRGEGESVEFLHVSDEEPILFMEALLYNQDGVSIARCKFYFMPEWYDVVLQY